MAWQLGTSYTTANFVNGGGESFVLGSYNSLQPGDALVRRSNGAGHMVMFLGWNNCAKTSACVLEQSSTALDMEYGNAHGLVAEEQRVQGDPRGQVPVKRLTLG